MANKVELNQTLPKITESEKLWQRAKGLIPSGTQTLAKGPSQFSNGVAPKYLIRGKGARVWDADGNEFLDFNMALGPIILGYSHDITDVAIKQQLEKGITFSLMNPLEVELAELLRDCIPNAESVRFSKTGCDVTSAAVRLARAFAGRDKVLCCGYHGWHDWYIATLGKGAGVPKNVQNLTRPITYNDIGSVIDAIDHETACIILEPLTFEKEQGGFVSELRDICDRYGALLIFDEMWTGFRCALGGAQEFLGVRADLCLFSKAMANGMPISTIVGRKDVMNLLAEDVFFYTTFGGEALSLAAAIACIRYLRDNDILPQISTRGTDLADGIARIISEIDIDYVNVSGYPFRTMMNFKAGVAEPLAMKTFVQQELIRRGILWSGINTLCFAHSDDDIKYTLDAYAEVIPMLKKAVEANEIEQNLKGEMLQPVFRKSPATR